MTDFAEGKSLILDRSLCISVKEAVPYQIQCIFPWVGAMLAKPWVSGPLISVGCDCWITSQERQILLVTGLGDSWPAPQWENAAESGLHRKTVELLLIRLPAQLVDLSQVEKGWSGR